MRIGQRRFEGASTAAYAGAIQSMIMDRVRDDVLEVNRPRLKRVAAALQAAGDNQARQIMATIAEVIEAGGSGGFRSSDVMGRVKGDPLGAAGNARTGRMPYWQPLSFKYALWKQKVLEGRTGRSRAPKAMISRAATSRDSFFVLSSRLQQQFAHQSRNFGGVKVKVITADLPGKRAVQVRDNDLKFLLGRFQIQVLPLLNTSLMPGLASRRWTDVGDGSFERATFGSKIANKLLGDSRHTPYRPLVLPIIQYFTLVRIPAALNAQLNRSLKNTLQGME